MVLFVAMATLLAPMPVVNLARTAQGTPPPLRVALECERASDFVFRFTLENISSEPTAAVIGWVLGNDRKYLPRQLGFTLKRTGEADVNFDWFDPSVPGIAGRVDPWLIPLPSAARYSVLVGIPNGFRHLFSRPADIRVRLTTQDVRDLNGDLQGLKFVRVWVGTLLSDSTRFPQSCRAG